MSYVGFKDLLLRRVAQLKREAEGGSRLKATHLRPIVGFGRLHENYDKELLTCLIGCQ
jgi:hypothetical protein